MSGTSTIKSQLAAALGKLEGMDEVEALIRTKFVSESKLLSEIPDYLCGLGGKRIRPLLTLLSARALGMAKPSQELIDVAAGIELIHMATLLHDDIIDGSPLRRHQQSPFVKFGVTNTLLAGDFLLVRAFSLCAHLDAFIIDETERACIELTEGEIEELALYNRKSTLENSLEIARKKTASLFRLACLASAHLSNASPECTKAMGRFGEKLGIAFQILDDILDVASDESLLGKKAGIDIHERKPSIVNVLWLDTDSPLAASLLRPTAEEPPNYTEAAINELRSSPALAQARRLAAEYVQEARLALGEALEMSPKTGDENSLLALQSLIDFTLERLQ